MSIGTPIKATARKRGRKAEHYKTSWDEPIYGLARRPSDGRWRNVATGEEWTEGEEELAIARFRQWERKQGYDTLTIRVPATDFADIKSFRVAWGGSV
ncbi:MAG TPA: hypothetical protein VER17_12210, partial [Tepidisphaeraceae bacterium]|nr:hypothetical protein [Tepidisphaeraceae bacterium]